MVAERAAALAPEQDLAVAGQLLVLRLPGLRLGLYVLQNLLGRQTQQSRHQASLCTKIYIY